MAQREMFLGVACQIAAVVGLLFAPNGAAAATTKPVVAVLHFETEEAKPYWGKVVAGYLASAIAYMGEYKPVAPEKIAKVLEGGGVKEGAPISAAEAAAFGKKVGAVIACRGKVAKAGNQYTVTVDFVNTATGAIITTKSAQVTGEENLSKAVDRIVGLTE